MNNFMQYFNDPPNAATATGYSGNICTFLFAYINSNAILAVMAGVLGLVLTGISIIVQVKQKRKSDIEIQIKEVELAQQKLQLQKLQKEFAI